MTYRPPLSSKILETYAPVGPVFMQGHVIQDGDLDIVFLDRDGNEVSPFKVTYEIGTVGGTNFHPIGSSVRIPVESRTGRFRPNFQVGDNWFTGQYECRWSVNLSIGDTAQVRIVPFTVTTAGLVDKTVGTLGVFDMSATVFVV